MRLANTLEDKAESSGVITTSAFSIKATAKSFSILSSSLYSNKIRAIVQELSANAKDSHIAAGTPDVPFDVHLPTIFEPHFAIRDYGTGLTHHEVVSIYTTYFASTKNDSNDFIGALGLGSKTPFSYTTNFSVTAIKNGVCCIYTAFIDDNGVPNIALLSETQTEEPNGVEVKFAVSKDSDCRQFAEEARSIFQYFKVQPKLSGNCIQIRQFHEVATEILPGVYRLLDNHSRAKMGDITYPIDIHRFKDDNIKSLLRCNVLLEFNIGELDIQANREGLSYIDVTINSITEKAKVALKSISDNFHKEVVAISNFWEQARFVYSKRHDNLYSSAAVDFIKSGTNPILVNNKAGVVVTLEDFRKFNIEPCVYYLYAHRKALTKEKGFIADSGKLSWKLGIDDNLFFINNDCKSGITARIKTLKTKYNGNTDIYVVLNQKDPQLPMDCKGFMDHIFNPTKLLIASDIKYAAQNRPKVQANNILAMSLEYNHKGNIQPYWRSCTNMNFSDLKPYYWVMLSHTQTVSERVRFLAAYDLARHAKRIGILPRDVVIYGVRKNAVDEVKGRSNWIYLEDFVEQQLYTFKDEIVADMATRRHDLYATFCRNTDEMYNSIESKHSNISLLMDLIENTKKKGYDVDIMYSYMTLIRTYCSDEFIKKKTQFIDEHETAMDDIIKDYPLLPRLIRNRSSYYATNEDITHYINLVDYVNDHKEKTT